MQWLSLERLITSGPIGLARRLSQVLPHIVGSTYLKWLGIQEYHQGIRNICASVIVYLSGITKPVYQSNLAFHVDIEDFISNFFFFYSRCRASKLYWCSAGSNFLTFDGSVIKGGRSPLLYYFPRKYLLPRAHHWLLHQYDWQHKHESSILSMPLRLCNILRIRTIWRLAFSHYGFVNPTSCFYIRLSISFTLLNERSTKQFSLEW